MNRFDSTFKPLLWLMALLLSAFLAACGGGGGGTTAAPATPANVIPGIAGTPGAAATNPTVISSSPSKDALNVATSTSGPGAAPVVTGKLVAATFNAAMNPVTINSAPAGTLLTFTLKETVLGTNVPGTVAMNAANTIATFTPTAVALAAGTKYTATITTAAKDAGGTAMPNPVAWSFTTAAASSAGQAQPNIGTASTYGVFASNAAVTLQANAVVNGNVGLNPAGACNNCVLGVTILSGGVIHNGDAPAIQAQSDFGDAYIEASVRATNACAISPTELSGAQGACNGFTAGPVYRAGLYRSAVSIGVGVGFNITLDAQNDPDAVFIFQTDAALTTGTTSEIILANGAQAKNVWWIVGSAATLGVSSIFKGNIIANGAAITVLNGTGGLGGVPTLVEGRLFSSAATVEVDSFATVTVPQ